MFVKKFLFLTLLSSFLSTTLLAAGSFSPRLGIGVSNQLINDLPAISLKLQKSREFALGALINLSTNDQNGGVGAGLKFFRIIFEEPQLNFYCSALGALIKESQNSTSNTGFQFDLTLGSEFTFQGLQSLGFSFEVGASINKMDELVIETVGHSFVTAAIHFYL